MNRTTSRHLASNIAADHWVAADRARSLRRRDEDETQVDGGQLATLRAWASRIPRGLPGVSRRTAADTAID